MSDIDTDTLQPPAEHVAAGNGTSGRYLTAGEAIENAPKDLEEADVEGVFGGTVRVRSLTAAQSARVKQESLNLAGRNPDIQWAAMEMLQFRLGVVEPKFTADQVRTLHLTSGASFAKVIARIDELSGLNKEELRQARDAFPGSDERAEVPASPVP